MVRHTSTTNTSSATSDRQPRTEGRANRNCPILIGVALVNSLAVDPADGTLDAATHTGVFRVPASKPAARIACRYQGTSGFAIVAPRRFLASGHPDPRENKPGKLALIESSDAAQTWHPVSLDDLATPRPER